MSTPSPWQIIAMEQKTIQTGKNVGNPFTSLKLRDQSGAEIKTSLFSPVPNLQIGSWINANIEKQEKDGKTYWNIKGAVSVINQTQQVLQPTNTGISVLPPPIVLPTTITPAKVDPPKIGSNAEEQYMYDELLKIVFIDCNTDDEKNISQHEFDECLSDKIKEYGITKLQAMKMFAKDNNLTVKPQPKPETKEEMMARMAKERDSIMERQIQAMEKLTKAIEILCVCVQQVATTTAGSKVLDVTDVKAAIEKESKKGAK